MTRGEPGSTRADHRTDSREREAVIVPVDEDASATGSAATGPASDPTRVPPTEDPALVASIPPSPPPRAPGEGASGSVPPEPSVPSRLVFLLMAVAGGILFLGFLVGTLASVEHPLAVVLVFTGVTMLVVVLILGAAGATDLPSEARIVMGVLAGLIVLFAAMGFLWVTQTPYATCGAIAAVPGVLALRAFTLLRDGFLFSPDPAPAP